MLGEAPNQYWWGKYLPWDPSIRVPLMCKGPNILKNHVGKHHLCSFWLNFSAIENF